ncbi:hypothetical protein BV898_17707 [Hypsibius exemplaris]|uniref:Uncharacterized protein n=1 Tax=Hypsibius exemplaris TaxID=2072580 RepID=A0A9X6NIE9_HYPEX|nr:hypothetical protein BV898_17707 [Hypsibius exemplaris]
MPTDRLGNGRGSSYRKLSELPVDRPSTVRRLSVNRPSTVRQPSVDFPSTVRRPSVNRPSTVRQPSVNRPSTVRRPCGRFGLKIHILDGQQAVQTSRRPSVNHPSTVRQPSFGLRVNLPDSLASARTDCRPVGLAFWSNYPYSGVSVFGENAE